MENQKRNNQELAKVSQKSLQLSTSKLTKEFVAIAIIKISKVYPSLTEGFYDVLIERIKFYKISDLELGKTINHIIDTNKYPPQVSDFISYMRPEGVADIPKEEKPYESIPDPVKEKEIADFNARLLAEE